METKRDLINTTKSKFYIYENTLSDDQIIHHAISHVSLTHVYKMIF